MLCAVLMITATDQLANVFKYGFERPRPCSLPELKETMRFAAVRCSGFGYFSAHAASAMAAAVFLGLFVKTVLQIPAVCLAFLGGLSSL